MTARERMLAELDDIMREYERGHLPIDDEYFAALYEHIKLEDEAI